jgi:hypothetical protein
MRGASSSRRADRALTALALAAVLASLGMRIAGRGPYSPGWDFVGPAQGLYVLSTRPPGEALVELARQSRDFTHWTTANSLLYTVLAGSLARVAPWEYWGHALTFALFLAGLLVLRRLAGLAWSECHVLLLGLGCSSALLSHAVAGVPYATGPLPHLLALAIVASERLRARPALTLAAALLVDELAWEVYESGKLVFVVWLAAALFERAAPLRTRLAWAAAGLAQIAAIAWRPGLNVRMALQPSLIDARALARPLEALWPATTGSLDLPVLILAGFACAASLKTLRAPVLAGFLAQLATLPALAAMIEGALRPRRFVASAAYALAVVVLAYADWSRRGARRPRIALLAALACGTLWQLADTRAYYSVPVSRRLHPLPYTHSTIDYAVFPSSTAFLSGLRERIARGETLVLVYGTASAAESANDPAGVPERLYLGLGHEAFARSVSLVSDTPCRFSCVPSSPVSGVAGRLRELLADGRADPLVVYKGELLFDGAAEETGRALRRILDGYLPRPEPDPAPGFHAFRVEPRARGASGFPGVLVRPGLERYETRDDAAPLAREQPARALPYDARWIVHRWHEQRAAARAPFGARPFRFHWSGELVACRSGSHDLLLAAEGGLRVRVDGREVARAGGGLLRLQRVRLPLERGPHRLELELDSFSAAWTAGRPRARLLADVAVQPADPWAGPVTPAECPP